MAQTLTGDIASSVPLRTHVRRLNRLALWIGVGIVSLALAAGVYALTRAGQQWGPREEKDNRTLVPTGRLVDQLLAGRPNGVIGEAAAGIAAPVDTSPAIDDLASGLAAPPPLQAVDPFAEKIEQAIATERLRVATARREEHAKAVLSQVAVPWKDRGDDADTSRETPLANGPISAGMPAATALQTLLAQGPRLGGPATSGGGAPRLTFGEPSLDTSDINRQDQKQAFTREASRPDNAQRYLDAYRLPPRSVLELKAGSIVPATLITGVNSDLPGQLLAQVSQNVLDSTHGEFVMIPQGARLIGRYDPQVTHGQERALVVWDRLIYPDGSSVHLKGMQGHDVQGYAGFRDRINNHYLRVFGSAFLMSFVQAGIATSQPNANGFGFGAPSAGDELRNALALEVGRVSTELIRRNLRIAPTLEIRPGFRFAVMVNKDMELPPYEPMQQLVTRRGRRP